MFSLGALSCAKVERELNSCDDTAWNGDLTFLPTLHLAFRTIFKRWSFGGLQFGDELCGHTRVKREIMHALGYSLLQRSA